MHSVILDGFPDYRVWEDGKVERIREVPYGPMCVIFGRVLASGYRQFKLIDRGGRQRLVRANRLVCEAFHGEAPTDRHHAAHCNGNRLDNRASNLAWKTAKENAADKIKHGTIARGSKTRNQFGRSRLDEQSVIAIRASFAGRRGDLARLSREYGISLSSVGRIISGESWAHVPGRSAADTQAAS